MPDEELTKNIR